MITKPQIVELLKTNDRAVARALVVLNERQTADEQASENTRYHNGRGFRPCHARMGTSMAKFYQRRGYLTPKQVAYWRQNDRSGRMRIEIYAGQLLDVAQSKEVAKTSVVGSYAAQAAVRDGMVKVNGEFESAKVDPYKGSDVGNLLEERMVLEEVNPNDPRIAQIDAAVKCMTAEREMQRQEAEADREQTRQEELAKFLARCRMETV